MAYGTWLIMRIPESKTLNVELVDLTKGTQGPQGPKQAEDRRTKRWSFRRESSRARAVAPGLAFDCATQLAF